MSLFSAAEERTQRRLLHLDRFQFKRRPARYWQSSRQSCLPRVSRAARAAVSSLITFRQGSTVGGGPTWIDVVTTVTNTSTILTYNYAISGSVVDKSVVNVAGTTSSSLVEEVQTFTTWDKAATRPWTSANSLFSAWVRPRCFTSYRRVG
jgi:hypothetical protein